VTVATKCPTVPAYGATRLQGGLNGALDPLGIGALRRRGRWCQHHRSGVESTLGHLGEMWVNGLMALGRTVLNERRPL
jgi:hypothetical protein